MGQCHVGKVEVMHIEGWQTGGNQGPAMRSSWLPHCESERYGAAVGAHPGVEANSASMT